MAGIPPGWSFPRLQAWAVELDPVGAGMGMNRELDACTASGRRQEGVDVRRLGVNGQQL
jgi:hypothetical protein